MTIFLLMLMPLFVGACLALYRYQWKPLWVGFAVSAACPAALVCGYLLLFFLVLLVDIGPRDMFYFINVFWFITYPMIGVGLVASLYTHRWRYFFISCGITIITTSAFLFDALMHIQMPW